MEIDIKLAYEDLESIRELFVEYTDMVVDHEPKFAHYLQLQRYEAELNHLGEKYGPPAGRLYLLKVDERPAGCIAMKRLDEKQCEMKRLYVRPAFRGRGLARRLVDRLLSDARQEGYQAMLLDTFPFLKQALGLYRRMGFYEIPCYNNSPLNTTIYMKKNLI